MAGAGWGSLAAASLVIGALIALRFKISPRVLGLIMGFGSGVLISAVAFDLVQEAADESTGHGELIAGIFAGCLVFFGGDWLIDRAGGSERKDATGGQAGGSPLAIVLGTVLDGIPASMVIGQTVGHGGAVGAAYLAAVFISNLPEAIASTSGLVSSGWNKSGISGCGLPSLSFRIALAVTGCSKRLAVLAFILTFAAGAILTMLATTMMPEAYEHGGKLVGVLTTLGFVVAFTIHLVD
jgi:ZIP family zinc transporter